MENIFFVEEFRNILTNKVDLSLLYESHKLAEQDKRFRLKNGMSRDYIIIIEQYDKDGMKQELLKILAPAIVDGNEHERSFIKVMECIEVFIDIAVHDFTLLKTILANRSIPIELYQIFYRTCEMEWDADEING
jgi:hypothetical protein